MSTGSHAQGFIAAAKGRFREFMQSRVAGDMGHLLVRQMGIKCLSFFAVSFGMRQLGPAGLGELGYAMAVGSVLALVTNLGFDTLLPKAMSEAGDRVAKQRVAARFYSLRLSLGMALLPVFIVGCALEITTGGVAKGGLAMGHVGLIWMASFLGFMATAFNPQPYSQGMDEIRKLGNAQVVSSVITSLLFICLMPLSKSAPVFVFIQAMGALVIAQRVMANSENRINITVQWRLFHPLLAHVKEAWPLILNVFVSYALYTSDYIFLAFCSEPIQVGLYGSAVALVNGVNVFIAVLPTVLYPRMLAWNLRSPEQMVRRSLYVAGGVLASIPLVYMFLRYATPYVLPLLLGRSFTAASPVFAALVCCFLVGVAYAIVTNALILIGRTRQVLYTTLIGAGFGLVLYPLCAAHGGASGVAHAKLAVVTIACVVAAGMTYFGRKPDKPVEVVPV